MPKAIFTNILQNIANLPNDSLSNDILLLRDILLYGYLLQKRDGIIRKSELVKYISPSGEGAISAAMATNFILPRLASQNGDNYTFSAEAFSAIPSVFDAQDYSLSQPVPYWGITGEQLVQYFCGMGAQPPRPLTDLAEAAFRNALQVDEVVRINSNILYVQINANVSFYVYIKQTDGALRFADANEIFAELGTHAVVGNDKHVLVCAANSDDNRTADQMKKFPLVYHAWSISVVGLFNILKQLIDDKGKGEISKRILRMFPEAKQAYFSEHLAKKQLGT